MKTTFLICTNCNKKFIRHGGNTPKTPFCSRGCRVAKQNRDRTILQDHGVGSRCAKCGEVKPISEFYSKGKRKQSYCRACLYLYQMKRWNKRKVQAIEYLGGVCAECGKGGHPATFVFHHRDPSDKECVFSKLKQRSWDKIKKELDKCDLLHGDCHTMRHIRPELWEDL